MAFHNLTAAENIALEDGEKVNGDYLLDAVFDLKIGTERYFRPILIRHYEGEINFQDTLDSIITIMAYSDGYMRKENLELVRIIRDAIGTSDWVEEGIYMGDYHRGNKQFHIDNIADIPKIIAQELEVNIVFAEKHKSLSNKIQPWTVPTNDSRRKEILSNEANYSDESIQSFYKTYEYMKEVLESDILPGVALDVIITHWDILYNYSCVYEAIEYCLLLSKKINDNVHIRRRLREFCKNYGNEKSFEEAVINQLTGKTKADYEHLRRMIAYAEKLTALSKNNK